MPIEIPSTSPTPVETYKWTPVTYTDEVPPSGNPIPVRLIAGHPNVSRTRAGRNVGHRSARIKPEFGRLGCRRSQAHRASHYHCSKHQALHDLHKSSIPPSSLGWSGFFV